MKQLKSSLGDLRRLFTRTITLRDIAEPLVSFDHTQLAGEVRTFMEQREFDVVGVREHGVVTGLVLRPDLVGRLVGEHQRPFGAADVLPDTDALHSAFAALRDRRYFFVTVLGHVGGIVTRGDLQKAPVRLWLFGLVSLLEMQMLRVVRERFPGDSWDSLLTSDRREGANRLFSERQRRNEASDLSDCLQLGDKATILMKDPELFAMSGFASKRALETFFKEVGMVRNALAHANDILSGRWPALVDLVGQLESLLERLERGVLVPTPALPTGESSTGS
ncbi:MAG: hypothetical protein JNN07_11895 [Verrucomicrobiales bacterium]|nr:hypothetical protein [Verrucomicrobiales bacterium]